MISDHERRCEKHNEHLGRWGVCDKCEQEYEQASATVELFHAVDQIQVTKTTPEKPKA